MHIVVVNDEYLNLFEINEGFFDKLQMFVQNTADKATKKFIKVLDKISETKNITVQFIKDKLKNALVSILLKHLLSKKCIDGKANLGNLKKAFENKFAKSGIGQKLQKVCNRLKTDSNKLNNHYSLLTTHYGKNNVCLNEDISLLLSNPLVLDCNTLIPLFIDLINQFIAAMVESKLFQPSLFNYIKMTGSPVLLTAILDGVKKTLEFVGLNSQGLNIDKSLHIVYETVTASADIVDNISDIAEFFG